MQKKVKRERLSPHQQALSDFPSLGLQADKKADSVSEFETTRNIDARQLNFKFVSLVVLILLIPVIGGLLHQHLDREAQLFQTD